MVCHAHRSLVSFLSVDRKASTKSPTFHTANVSGDWRERHTLASVGIIEFNRQRISSVENWLAGWIKEIVQSSQCGEFKKWNDIGIKGRYRQKISQPLTQGIQHAGFQGNLQVQSPLAKVVTGDSESITNSRTLHTLNVMAKYKKGEILIYAWIYELG